MPNPSLLLGFLLRIVPKFLYPAVAVVIVVLLRLLARKEMAWLHTNIQHVFGLPPHSSFARSFVGQCLRHQVICALETLRAVFVPGSVTVLGYDEFARTLNHSMAGGRGVVIAAAHLGSWELVGHYLAQASGAKMHALAKPSQIPGVRALLDGVRARLGIKVLWTDSKSLTADIMRALKAGEVVGFVMDQKPQGRKGPVVKFMGIDTEFVPGPAVMATRTNAAIVAAFCLRVGPWQYRLVAKEIIPADHGRSDVEVITALLAQEIEAAVRAYPEQWTWNYKRWRFSSAAPRPL